MLLSIFGQENFVSKDKTTKDFPIDTEYPEIKELLDILHYVAIDKQARKELDEELYYQRYVEQTKGEKDRKIEEYKEKLEEKGKELEEKGKELEEKGKELEEKGKELEEARQKNKSIAQKMKKRGMSAEEISELTGLTIEEI
jgi:predicted ribosome quality control (RQC) complex YloA/Tae2 family protein